MMPGLVWISGSAGFGIDIGAGSPGVMPCTAACGLGAFDSMLASGLASSSAGICTML